MTDAANQKLEEGSRDDDVVSEEEKEEEEESDDQAAGYGASENKQTVEYITTKFEKRVCRSFVPKNSDLCRCGYPRDSHPPDVTEGESKWTIETSTKTEETDSFGVVEFPAYGRKSSKYVRVDHKTDVEDLWTLMSDRWQMEKPHLLISVTGGAQKLSTSSSLKPVLRDVFRRGLVQAAQSTGAWIITGGTNTGVMKLVGDAIRAHTLKQGSRKQLVAIGIATWGCIKNRELLITTKGAFYECHELKKGVAEAPLDPNHTHFILVDDGRQHEYGAEIELRAKLEKKISDMEACEVKIPIVCIVIEGGKNTIETVVQAIKANTPVIVVDGSGRAADLLAFAYNEYKEPTEDAHKQQSVEKANRRLWEDLKKRMLRVKFKEEDQEGILANIQFCLDHRNMITVFPLEGKGSAGGIDYAIIMTLLRVKEGATTSTLDKMKLALAWDRIDVVKENIYTDDVKLTDDEVQRLAFTAIVNNRVEFVKFFLERRLRLTDLLATKEINDFYTKGMKKNKHLKNALKEVTTLDEDLDPFIQKLVEQLFNPANLRKLRQHYHQKQQQQLYQRQLSGGTGNSYRMKKLISKPTVSTKSTVPTKFAASTDLAAMELFFWAILSRLQPMAIVFLYEAKETFALSLIGHLMLKNLLKMEKDSESAQELQRQVDFFEGLSTGILAECYSSNQEMTIDLLVRPIQIFDGHTALEMAVQANNQSVLAHQACQNLLTLIWMGRIDDENPHYRSLLLRIPIPPFFLLAPLLLKFREETPPPPPDQSEEVDQNEEKEDEKKASESLTGKASPETGAPAGNPVAESRYAPFCIYCKRLEYFLTAPCVKFTFNCLSYVAFLLLYSLLLLTNFYPTISTAEIILIVWVVTIVGEEIRQLVEGRPGDSRKLHNYLSNKWNWVDIVAVTTFVVGLVLRLISSSACGNRCFFAARIVLAFSLMTFYFRILHMFSIFRQLGPKLVMIGQMMIDLLYFMTILMVFIVAYGVAAHVILYPNQELRLSLVRDVLSGAWWSVYGEFNIEEVSGESCEASAFQTSSPEDCASMEYDDFNRTLCPGKDEKCPVIDWFGPILLAIYALITNVMMINLLIAMFSNTFAKVEGIADVIWKIQRYHLVLDYESHPILPPPLIILEHAFRLIRTIWRKLRSSKNGARPDPDAVAKQQKSRNRTFRMALRDERDLMAWLNANVEEYLLRKEAEEAAAEHLAKETNKRIDQLYRKIEETDQSRNLDARLKSLEDKMSEIISLLSPKPTAAHHSP